MKTANSADPKPKQTRTRRPLTPKVAAMKIQAMLAPMTPTERERVYATCRTLDALDEVPEPKSEF